jgi:hypothetical protein
MAIPTGDYITEVVNLYLHRLDALIVILERIAVALENLPKPASPD